MQKKKKKKKKSNPRVIAGNAEEGVQLSVEHAEHVRTGLWSVVRQLARCLEGSLQAKQV